MMISMGPFDVLFSMLYFVCMLACVFHLLPFLFFLLSAFHYIHTRPACLHIRTCGGEVNVILIHIGMIVR